MKIVVFGAGYVGLVTAAHLAARGYHTVCVEANEQLVNELNGGQVHIHEPLLEQFVGHGLKQKMLEFTNDATSALKHANIVIIAVGTPSLPHGDTDLSQVYQVVYTIGTLVADKVTVVMKSTVPVGTANDIQAKLASMLADQGKTFDCEIISNPEFLQEGHAVHDVLSPQRIIIGSANQDSEAVQEYVNVLTRGEHCVLHMDNKSAELTKYAANAMLAARISFMNEMARFAMRTGANIDSVRIGVGSDRRIGSEFLEAGIGYGGSCLPKDVTSLIRQMEQHLVIPEVLQAIHSTNLDAPTVFVNLVLKRIGQTLSNKKIAILGFSFKEGTTDIRSSQSLDVLQLIAVRALEGVHIALYDPLVCTEQLDAAIIETKEISQADIVVCENLQQAVHDADVVLVLTKMSNSIDLVAVKQLVNVPIVFDGKNQFDPHQMSEMGFEYHSIGRPATGIEYGY